jgi:DNA repair protein RadA/Sms
LTGCSAAGWCLHPPRWWAAIQGIGKSTLLMQAAARFAQAGLKVIYVSGEEASAQIRMRADSGSGCAIAPVKLATRPPCATSSPRLRQRRRACHHRFDPDHVGRHGRGAPGSVSQVRAAAHELTTFAKRKGCSVILVGHVTKEGQIAGPRVVEHMVDTVLYFEGERGHQFRILRASRTASAPPTRSASSR